MCVRSHSSASASHVPSVLLLLTPRGAPAPTPETPSRSGPVPNPSVQPAPNRRVWAHPSGVPTCHARRRGPFYYFHRGCCRPQVVRLPTQLLRLFFWPAVPLPRPHASVTDTLNPRRAQPVFFKRPPALKRRRRQRLPPFRPHFLASRPPLALLCFTRAAQRDFLSLFIFFSLP